LYPKSAHALALTLLENGPRAARHFAQRCWQAHLVRAQAFEPRPRDFVNWNYPADVTKGLSSSGRHRTGPLLPECDPVRRFGLQDIGGSNPNTWASAF